MLWVIKCWTKRGPLEILERFFVFFFEMDNICELSQMTMLFVPETFPCSIDLSCPRGSDGFALTPMLCPCKQIFWTFFDLISTA